MTTKHYLLTLLMKSTDNGVEQDAVEDAIISGRIPLSYNLKKDLVTIAMHRAAAVAAYVSAKQQSDAHEAQFVQETFNLAAA